MFGLFDIEAGTPEPNDDPREGRLGPDALIPRPYQIDDIAAAQKAWASGARAVLYRAATGLGKATVLATLAAKHRPQERTLCLIDDCKLARQLRETFARQLGWTPGLIGGGEFVDTDARVVIAVVQSLKVEHDGESRAQRLFDPTTFGTLLIDETESALADGYMGVVRHWMNGNPDLHLLGCTATPLRGDGVGMGALFDHVIEEEGTLNRGPLWAFGEGWLVPPRQMFVQVSADFNSLKIRKGESGDKDYSDEQIGKLLANEQHLIEMAQGVVRAAGAERSIVVCPNSTDLCDSIAEYINGQKPESARSVHSKMRDPDSVMAAHQRGEFQFLCGVNKLTKGYDDPTIRNVFILRPTKSQRLFQQIIGRAFRPHKSIAKELGELPDSAARRAAIASSVKPHCNVFCLVGVSKSTRDMTIVDLLRGRLTDEELERVKEKMLDGEASGQPQRSVEEVVKEVRREMRDEHEARQRRKIEIEKAEVAITEYGDEHIGNAPPRKAGPYETLRRFGWKDYEMNRLNDEQAGRYAQQEIARSKHKPPLASKGQRRVLQGRGMSEADANGMSRAFAGKVMEQISKIERWGPEKDGKGHRVSGSELRGIVDSLMAEVAA